MRRRLRLAELPSEPLVELINATDGILYVVEGECGHGVRACLLPTMTMAGPNRVAGRA